MQKINTNKQPQPSFKNSTPFSKPQSPANPKCIALSSTSSIRNKTNFSIIRKSKVINTRKYSKWSQISRKKSKISRTSKKKFKGQLSHGSKQLKESSTIASIIWKKKELRAKELLNSGSTINSSPSS